MLGAETLQDYTVAEVPQSNPLQLTINLAREYLWGERFPEPVAMVDMTDAGDEIAGTPEVFTYLLDALGNVVALADDSGAVVEQYVYDPYGQTYIEDAAGQSRLTSAYGNPFMWTGQRYDAVSGLYHFTYRTYSPTLGRWLHRDPLGYVDGVNLYGYVGGNPLVWTDPYGLWGESFWDWVLGVKRPAGVDPRFAPSYDRVYEVGWQDGKAGAVIGCKAIGNAAADTVISTVTLGEVDGVMLIAVSEDEERFYVEAYLFARGGTEGLATVLTAGASNSAKYGKAFKYLDTATNVNMLAMGAEDIAQNGLDLQNATQVGAAIVGLGGTRACSRIDNVADEVSDSARLLPDDANVVRGGRNLPEDISRGTGKHPDGVVGVSVESAPGKSVEELSENIPHNQVGTTTVGDVRSAGGDVIPTSGRSQNHATMTGLSPEAASDLLRPTIPNPAKKGGGQ